MSPSARVGLSNAKGPATVIVQWGLPPYDGQRVERSGRLFPPSNPTEEGFRTGDGQGLGTGRAWSSCGRADQPPNGEIFLAGGPFFG